MPNPRVWKALIAADLCGVEVEVSGDKGANLGSWLWDYEARPLDEQERTADSPHARMGRRGFSGTLFKTDAFLAAHPFGTVPAAFSPDGEVGIFESASRIDSFLDANLVFAREAQVYLLGMREPDAATHERMAAAYEFYLAGVESALGRTAYLAGDELSIADISFVCDFAQFLREGHYEDALTKAGLPLVSRGGAAEHPKAYAHMLRLSETDAFAKHMGTYLNWYRRKMAAEGA